MKKYNKHIKFRKDAFVFGFSLKPDYRGINPLKRYFVIWIGFIEINLYAGTYKLKTSGGK